MKQLYWLAAAQLVKSSFLQSSVFSAEFMDSLSGKCDVFQSTLPWESFPTRTWICPSPLRKWQFIFSDATRLEHDRRDSSAQTTNMNSQLLSQDLYSTPVQTFWTASTVYTYLFHLFPLKQLGCKPRGNPSCESSAHTFQPVGREDIIDTYMDRVNVDKH